MGYLRRILRFSALGVWFVIPGCVALVCVIGGWGAVKRVSYITRIWGKGIAKILSLKINIIGDLSKFNSGLIVSNHTGYFDIIAHASVFSIRFAPKVEILHWPVLGWYLALSRPIWIDRRSKQKTKRTMKKFKETMEHGIPLIVYPEGTSTDGKHGILPFKSTPFEAAASTNSQIHPILTIYREPKDRKISVCWWEEMTLFGHAWIVLGYPCIQVEIHVLPTVLPEGRNRKEIAKEVHDIMEKEYLRIMENNAQETSIENSSESSSNPEQKAMATS